MVSNLLLKKVLKVTSVCVPCAPTTVAKFRVIASENDPRSGDKKKNFLEDIFRVLLHARRILSASYCIGYFIPEDLGEAVNAHETLQVGHRSDLSTRSLVQLFVFRY